MKSTLFTLLLCFCCGLKLSAQVSISGTVNSSSGSLPGANIFLEGTSYFTVSANNGAFSFKNLKKNIYKLHCKYLGYEEFVISITLDRDTSLILNLIQTSLVKGEVIVNATRANRNSGMAYSEINAVEIAKINSGADVPYLLQEQPSVVVTSDAGAGIGYTGIRIRGSDASRINVSINGIPINDAESQQMYWVDLPDFASSTENIQVQRGVGTSSNGAGAFGGSINLLSSQPSREAFAQSSSSFGSFNTIKNNISIGSGLLNNHWTFEGRLSRIKSDGYVDRAFSDLKSYFFSANYIAKSTNIRFNTFSGKEITYQSWNGIPESRFKNDIASVQEYINNNGLDQEDAANLLNSGRTYNYYTYDNQVDDYQQDHYQLLITQDLHKSWVLNFALHLTKGSGFYEEYKKSAKLEDYYITPPDSLHAESDLIRRKWLDNDFYGSTLSLVGELSSKIKTTIASAWNRYDGQHFGEVIWAQNAGNSAIRHRYYNNNAIKDDFNAYLKTEIELPFHFNFFTDLQIRTVSYEFDGLNDEGETTPQNKSLSFFNPKGGLTWRSSKNHELYGSVSVAHKEPNRDDYTESPSSKQPKPEAMIDYEAGYRYTNSRLRISANFYFMNYKDQLVLTGQLNDVGNYTRINIDKSYRAGIELSAGISVSSKIKLDGNISFSRNKIQDFTEYLDVYDQNYEYAGQFADKLSNVNIAFSPSIISAASITWLPVKNLEVKLISKYVGEQFLKNTNDKSRSLEAYSLFDFQLNYSLEKFISKEIFFGLKLNNLFNEMYASNGYTYDAFFAGSRSNGNYYYPQAGFNMIGQVTLKF